MSSQFCFCSTERREAVHRRVSTSRLAPPDFQPTSSVLGYRSHDARPRKGKTCVLCASRYTLISVEQAVGVLQEKLNKMSVQNISIVLSPTMQISHRVLNIFFLYAKFLFRDTVIKK